MYPLKVGIVGIGKIARDQHIPVLRADRAFKLEACASRHAQVEGVANFASIESMLDGCPDLDAVTICTPPQIHYEAARLALQRGKHVLLEKPPCATTAELSQLTLLANSRGCTLFQSWHSRHAAGVARARQWLEGQNIQAVRVIWKEDVRKWHPGQTWLWQAGGFGVFDPGINAISILTEIVPQAIFVGEACLFIPNNCDAPIAADLVMSTEAGAPISATFDFRHTGPQTWDIEVETGNGVLKLADGGSRLFVGGQLVPIEERNNEYASLYRRFAQLVAARISEVDGRPFQLVADAFLVGRRVTVDRFDD